MQQFFRDGTLYSERELAEVLGIAPQTVRTSRVTGRLLGREAPRHVNIGGRCVRYPGADANRWVNVMLTEAGGDRDQQASAAAG